MSLGVILAENIVEKKRKENEARLKAQRALEKQRAEDAEWFTETLVHGMLLEAAHQIRNGSTDPAVGRGNAKFWTMFEEDVEGDCTNPRIAPAWRQFVQMVKSQHYLDVEPSIREGHQVLVFTPDWQRI
jgi:hypothetical protein